MLRRAATAPCAACALGRSFRRPDIIVQPPVTRRTTRCQAQDTDVQVFRFTLGIPGFDDANIPRVVGCVGALLLIVNHILGADPAPEAQVIGEAIGSILALVLVALPSIEERLKEASGTLGRRAASDSVPGAASAFVYDKSLPDAVAKELAWTTFVALRNTNTCSVLIVQGGRVLLARGAIADRAADESGAVTLAGVSSTVATCAAAGLKSGLPETGGTYMATRGDMQSEGLDAWTVVPQGALAALMLPLGDSPDSFLLLLSEFNRGFAPKERMWLACLAQKLRRTCADV